MKLFIKINYIYNQALKMRDDRKRMDAIVAANVEDGCEF